ncbi:hypothetical protein BGX28_003164 [Mortierella sp. GBA30]|nr:hypothetical protein BGX28_003164 [Mortierella sp. GBA30]
MARSKILPNRIASSLPSPPLSPLQFNDNGRDNRRSSLLPLPPLASSPASSKSSPIPMINHPTTTTNSHHSSPPSETRSTTTATRTAAPILILLKDHSPSSLSQSEKVSFIIAKDSVPSGPFLDSQQESLDDPTTSPPSPPQVNVNPSFEEGEKCNEELDLAAGMLLPSQLRRRHESLRLVMARQQGQKPITSVYEPTVVYHEKVLLVEDTPRNSLYLRGDDDDEQSESGDGQQSTDDSNSTDEDDDIDLINIVMGDHLKDDEKQEEEDKEDVGEMEFIGSYHSSAMIRAKSQSMFESRPPHITMANALSPLSTRTTTASNMGKFLSEMSNGDWIKVQSKIQALEMEVSHISRTNRLLNEELDKLTGILARLTTDNMNGDYYDNHDDRKQREDSTHPGWRREYEFLVQQVDLMHRQLQLAQSERVQLLGRVEATERDEGEKDAQMGVLSGYQAEVTRQLHAEVKDLTSSLKKWQSALRQTEDQYRRKCDGERALKRTLKERESQLSSLMERLSSYESKVLESISNDKEELLSSSEEPPTSDSNNNIGLALNESAMPGTFPGADPGETQSRSSASAADQLAMSLLSWAALLVTSMMS